VQDWTEIVATVQRTRFPTLALAFALYVLLNLVRAWRFRLLLPGQNTSFLAMWNVTCIHTLANYVMPARTGELTYIALLRAQRVPVADGLASLGLARLLDLVALSAWVLSTVVLTSGRRMHLEQIQLVAIPVGLAMLAILLWVDRLADRAVRLGQWAAGRLRVDGLAPVRAGLALAERTAESLRVLARSRRLYWTTLALSLGQWLINFGVYYVLLNELGATVDLGGAVIASAVSSLLIVLPIQGLIGFGTYEAAWTVALLPLGVARSTAIAIGFGMHILMLVLSLLLAGLSVGVVGVARVIQTRGRT
jgi:uncharacterized protein (TIRG00374 family)